MARTPAERITPSEAAEGGMLTLEDILHEADRGGLEISERTFRYYAVMGLLPRPMKGADDARVHYYPPDVMARLLEIRRLQAQGFSLKSIKDYLGAAEASAPAAATPAPAPAAAEPSAARADVFLRSFSGSLAADAARRFLASATADLREETLRGAALAYYQDVLGLYEAATGVPVNLQEIIPRLTPLEVETLLRPLRSWRNREWMRRREGGGLPLATSLREVAAARLAGTPVDTGRLQAVREMLDAASRRLAQMPGALPASVGSAARWVEDAVLDLTQAAAAMLVAETPAAVAEALQRVDRAERTVVDVTEMLTAWHRLASARKS